MVETHALLSQALSKQYLALSRDAGRGYRRTVSPPPSLWAGGHPPRVGLCLKLVLKRALHLEAEHVTAGWEIPGWGKGGNRQIDGVSLECVLQLAGKSRPLIGNREVISLSNRF